MTSSLPTLSATTGENTLYILDLGASENQINPAWVDAVNTALDNVEQGEGPAGLVTTASGKSWSTGFDLAWLTANPDQFADFTTRFERLLVRMLTLKVPTVAAIQGHVFGAAAMFALAHDYRVMRRDRGYFCFPEINLGLSFPPSWVAIITAKLPAATAHSAMTTGQRYGGTDAVTAAIASDAVTEDLVTPTASEKVTMLSATAGPTLSTIKTRLYGTAVTLTSTVG